MSTTPRTTRSRSSRGGGQGEAADHTPASPSPLSPSSPSPSLSSPSSASRRRSLHTRQWTHTTLQGFKQTRLHRKKPLDAPDEKQEEEEEDEVEEDEEVEEEKEAEEEQEEKQAEPAAEADPPVTVPADDSQPMQLDAIGEDQEQEQEEVDNDYDVGGGLDAGDEQYGAEAEAEAAPVAASADSAAASESAVPTPSAQPDPVLWELLQRLQAYSSQSEGYAQQQPPFELFTSLLSHLRSKVEAGETHVAQPPAEQESTGEEEEEKKVEEPASELSPLSLHSLLHHTRVQLAQCYPLPSNLWLEWIEDVQRFGSGVEAEANATAGPSSAAAAPLTAEEHESLSSASSSSDQLFLLSLYRFALADFASPEIWESFLAYITKVSHSLLTSEATIREFRRIAKAAVYPRGVVEERKRRAQEKKEAARVRRAQRKQEHAANGNKKQQKDGSSMSDEDDDEDDSSEEDDSDADSDEEFSSDEEPTEEDSTSPSPLSQLHPALHPLLTLPYSHTSLPYLAALPSPVPIGYSYPHGDQVFQKLRGVEMQLLARCMQQLRNQQEQGEAALQNGETPVDEEEVMQQMERISRLYRIELTIPLKDLESVYSSFQDWQSKQGTNEPDPLVASQFEESRRLKETLESKFEKQWAELEEKGQLAAGVGGLSPEAQQLFDAYVNHFSHSSKARAACRLNPSPLFAVLERIVAVGFLDANWWVRFVRLAEQLSGAGMESRRYVLEVVQRALRNCPWEARLACALVQALESLQAVEPHLTRQGVEATVQHALAQPAMQANIQGRIEVHLQMVGYYRRTVLAYSPAADPAASADSPSLSLADAMALRSHFTSIRGLLPYLPSVLSPSQVSSCAARVYRLWVDVEYRWLWQQLGDGVNEDAHTDAETAAAKEGVSLSTFRARQLFRQYAEDDNRGSSDAQPWLEWVTFELRWLDVLDAAGAEQADMDAHVAFIRGVLREGVDRMTSSADFSPASSASLSALSPLLHRWLDFELLHSRALSHLQQAQQRCGKYLDALKEVQAQEAQRAAQQAWQAQAQVETAQTEEEQQEVPTWLNTPLPSKSSSDKQQKNESGKKRAGEKKPGPKKGGAAGEQAKGNKRKRETGEAGEESISKKGKAPSAAVAAAPSADSPAAAAANDSAAPSAPTPAPSPRTLYVLNLSWTLREPDYRQIFSPYGSVQRILSHKASKTQKKAYVEVQYETEAECAAAMEKLQGKVQQGKRLIVLREPPSDKPSSAAAAAPSAASPSSPDEVDPLSVFVKNLPRDLDDLPERVRAHFAACGEIKAVKIPKAQPQAGSGAAAGAANNTPKWKNFGTIIFASPAAVPLALQLHLSTLSSQQIQVVPNQAPARERKLKDKMAAEVKRKASASSARLKFVPRAAILKANAATEADAQMETEEGEQTAAPTAAIATSNADFRAMLLAGKK